MQHDWTPSEASKITYGVSGTLLAVGLFASFLFGREWLGPEIIATALVFIILYEIKR